MTLIEYADLVAELRAWQQKHRGGDPTAYATVKKLEKKVDFATAAIRRDRQSTLTELFEEHEHDQEQEGQPS